MSLWKAILLLAAAMAAGFAWGRSRPEGARTGSIGAEFQSKTSLTASEVLSSLLRWGSEPEKEKEYEGAQEIVLPDPSQGNLTLEEAIDRRRSIRDYSGRPLPIASVSRLLHASSGITGEGGDPHLRSAPSAGALYPIETYVVAYRVEGIPSGIYHYRPSGHRLELIREGDFRDEFIAAGLHQDMAGRCNLLYILTAVFRRATWKYGERGYRYAYIEAGAMSQNIYLQATSLGLGSVVMGAFFDDRVLDLIGVDGRKEAPILLQAVGTR